MRNKGMHCPTNAPGLSLPARPALMPSARAEAEITALCKRYRAARGLGINLLERVGKQADGVMELLPAPVGAQIEALTDTALRQAMGVAHASRGVLPGQPPWVHRLVSTTLGALGGSGGSLSTAAELPITTTLLLRGIQDVAVAQGFDAASDNVQFDCVQVFAAAGPLASDSPTDLAFLGTRMALINGGLHRLIAWVVPRLAVVLGQKLAVQAVPVVGAATGAATNFIYTRYYQDMAYIHFRLRALALALDIPQDDLVARLQQRLAPPGSNGPAG